MEKKNMVHHRCGHDNSEYRFRLVFIFNQRGANSLTVSELRSQVETIYPQQLRVITSPGSANWDDKVQVIRFALTDDRESMSIICEGIVSDVFKPGADLKVQSRYRTNGVFEALSFDQPNSCCSFYHKQYERSNQDNG